MILIFSDENEQSTDDVIDWIHFLGGSFRRINDNVLLREKYSLELNVQDISFQSDVFLDVDIIWYRRGLFFHNKELSFNSMTLEESSEINKILDNEKSATLSNICHSLDVKWLSNPLAVKKIEKFKVLNLAKDFGIDIPNSLITNSKNSLLDFYYKNKESIIVKAVKEIHPVKVENDYYFQYTRLVLKTMIDEMEDIFPPSLYQENLEKDYEVRSFYLNKKFYSMAIFSQKDSQTKIDFREYNYETPNRTVPFKLPQGLEKKLISLMEALKLDTGSIDIVKTLDNRYVFLEVNPIGQFGMVSYPCNFPIERDIASYLIEKTK